MSDDRQGRETNTRAKLWTKGRNVGKSEHPASYAAEMAEAVNEPPRIIAGSLVVSTVSEAEASSVELAMARTVADGVVVRTEPATVTISYKSACREDNGLVVSGRDPGSCHVGSVVRVWHPGIGQEVKCIVMHDKLPAAFPVGVRIDDAAALGWYKNVSGEWCKASSPDVALAIAKAPNPKEEHMAKGNVALDIGTRPRAIALRAYGNTAVVAARIRAGHAIDLPLGLALYHQWGVLGDANDGVVAMRLVATKGENDARPLLSAAFDMMQIRKGRGDYYMEMDLPHGTEIRLTDGTPAGVAALRSMMPDGSAAVGFFDHRDEFPFKGAGADKPKWVPHAAAATDKPKWVPHAAAATDEPKWVPLPPSRVRPITMTDHNGNERVGLTTGATNTPTKITTPEELQERINERGSDPNFKAALETAAMVDAKARESAIKAQLLAECQKINPDLRGGPVFDQLADEVARRLLGGSAPPTSRPALFWQDNTGALCCGDPPEGFLGTERILSPEAVCELHNRGVAELTDAQDAAAVRLESIVVPNGAQVVVITADTQEAAARIGRALETAWKRRYYERPRGPVLLLRGKGEGFDVSPVPNDALAAVGLARLTDAELAVVEAMRKAEKPKDNSR